MATGEWKPAAASRYRPDATVGTPLHDRTAAASATPWFFNWDLHHVVDVYSDFNAELRAIRETVAMGDMSPLCKATIAGPDASRFVDWLVPRRTDNLAVGQIFYTPWCNDDGHVVSDGLVYRLAEDSYRFTGDPTCEWFRSKADGFDVAITDDTDSYGIVMVQGPNSRQVVEAATSQDWSGLDFSRRADTTMGGATVELARQGFTGELGYEVMMASSDGPAVWDAISAAGEPFGIQPCGEYAIDVARVEAGLMIPGPDYANAGPDPCGSHTVSAADPEFRSTPAELGMGSFVDLAKPDFVGRDALVAEAEAGGPRRTLVGLDIDWKHLVQAHLDRDIAPTISPRVEWVAKSVVCSGHAGNGRATSVTWAPSIGKLIGFGHLPTSQAGPGTSVNVQWDVPETQEQLPIPATVADLPFLTLRRT